MCGISSSDLNLAEKRIGRFTLFESGGYIRNKSISFHIWNYYVVSDSVELQKTIGTNGNRDYWFANRGLYGYEVGMRYSNDEGMQFCGLYKGNQQMPDNEVLGQYPLKFLIRFDGWETALKEENNGSYTIVPR